MPRRGRIAKGVVGVGPAALSHIEKRKADWQEVYASYYFSDYCLPGQWKELPLA